MGSATHPRAAASTPPSFAGSVGAPDALGAVDEVDDGVGVLLLSASAVPPREMAATMIATTATSRTIAPTMVPSTKVRDRSAMSSTHFLSGASPSLGVAGSFTIPAGNDGSEAR